MHVKRLDGKVLTVTGATRGIGRWSWLADRASTVAPGLAPEEGDGIGEAAYAYNRRLAAPAAVKTPGGR
jgi:hypothetical protein